MTTFRNVRDSSSTVNYLFYWMSSFLIFMFRCYLMLAKLDLKIHMKFNTNL